MSVGGEGAPDSAPPNFESLVPAPRVPSPGLLGLYIPSPDRSWAPVPWASGVPRPPILSTCPPGLARSPGSSAPAPAPALVLGFQGPPPAPDLGVLALRSPPFLPRFVPPSGPGPSPAAPGPASSSNSSGARTDGGGIRPRRRTRVPGPMAARRDPPSSLLPPSLGSGRVPGQPQRRQLRRSEAAGPPRPQPRRFAPPRASPALPAPRPASQGPCPPPPIHTAWDPRTLGNSGRPRGEMRGQPTRGGRHPSLVIISAPHTPRA